MNTLHQPPSANRSTPIPAVFLVILAFAFGTRPASAVDCDATSLFARWRASALISVGSNNDTGVQAVAQRFEAPQGITLSGFTFYGFVPDGEPAVDVTASIYLPDEDGFPQGEPLTTTLVTVDTPPGDGTIFGFEHRATFPTPVLVEQPYLLVLENDSPDFYWIISNDLAAGDGNGEGLSAVLFAGSWRNGLDQTFDGGTPFDADFVLEPHYSTSIETTFTAPTACLAAPGSIDFQAQASPILTSRFYNGFIAVLDESPFQWSFGDGGTGEGDAPSHSYGAVGPWTTELEASLGSPDGICVTSAIGTVGTVPQELETAAEEDFETLSVAFAATAVGADRWYWDFGDSNSSTEQNPVHAYGELGFHTACANASNLCGQATSDGVCTDVLSPFPDLSLDLQSTLELVEPGMEVTYDLVITNDSGASTGSQDLTHAIPGALIDVTWTCNIFGSGSCSPSGSGDLSGQFVVDALSSLIYSASGTLAEGTVEPLILTASATVPEGDMTANNSDTLVLESAGARTFVDGFESGDTAAWSSATHTDPTPPVQRTPLEEPPRGECSATDCRLLFTAGPRAVGAQLLPSRPEP